MDPVMLIKIPFIQYLYGIKSMRQTMKEIEVNVAYRWFLGLDMLVLISFISHLQSRSVLLLRFARLGRHQTVQLCISWERIFKRHQISGTADQTMAGTHIGDVG